MTQLLRKKENVCTYLKCIWDYVTCLPFSNFQKRSLTSRNLPSEENPNALMYSSSLCFVEHFEYLSEG